MKFIKLSNKGLLEPKLIPLMGGTTKKDDVFKIGQFGTGLKYALAFFVRNKIAFKLFVGKNEVIIESQMEEISGQDFDIIYINGERTSITAQMGFDWNPWMIIREIWCNALDEGNARREIVINPIGQENTTSFFIEMTVEFAKVWQNWTKYFIQEFEPIYIGADFSIYAGGDSFKLYKQGILIHELTNMPSVFSYDIKNASLNELRQFQGSPDYEVTKCLMALKDPKIITNFLETANENHFEAKMDCSWFGNKFNKHWKETIGEAKIIHAEAVSNVKARGLDIDHASMIVVPKNIFNSLTVAFEGVGALRIADKVNEFYEIFNQELDLKIKQSLAILDSCGYFIDPELVFIYGVFGDKTTLAKVNLDKKEILVSEQMLDKPIFDVVSMIIEENEHYRTGMQDCTRAFQQHFIDLFTKTLLDKNEVLL